MATMKDFISNFAKLEKFVGVDFRRWQKKRMFMLTTLNVAYVISSPKPDDPKEDDPETEVLEQNRKRSKWDNDDFSCRGHILNGMQDALFDIYQYHDSAKELWDALENKYMAEDASSKKFLVSNFNSYKMVEDRPIIDQFHELQRMHANLKLHKIEIDEVFLVSSIIDKLSPSWRDVRHALKHKREEITLSDLGQHIIVESSIRVHENRKDDNPNVPTINMVGEGKPQSRPGDKRKRNDSSKGKATIPNTEKVCWECGKPGHRRKNCFVLKNKQKKAKGSGQASTSKRPSTQG